MTWYKGSLGYAYGVSGNRANAELILRELEDLAKRQYVDPGAFVSIYLGLGETNKALDWMEKCHEEQAPFTWHLKSAPIYDRLRPEPRFLALLKKVGLDQ